ncbi:hypothetical protein [Actinoallomurus acaciae]|uniref:FCD domain-containing protein n=1 Tax=Actinoallomurus acaciae TaxID=502577 RepID=A0ABV5YHS3_9ACTN
MLRIDANHRNHRAAADEEAHAAIVNAIRDRRSEAAAQITRRHLTCDAAIPASSTPGQIIDRDRRTPTPRRTGLAERASGPRHLAGRLTEGAGEPRRSARSPAEDAGLDTWPSNGRRWANPGISPSSRQKGRACPGTSPDGGQEG